MREATRRQILSDMGIVVWRLRASEPLPVREAAAAPAGGPAPDAGSRQSSPAPAPRSTPDARRPPVPPPTRRPVPPTAAEVRPWSAVSLAVPGVVLLGDGAGSRRDLRLARDILAAATGDWRAKPVRRRFAWPDGLTHDAVTAADGGRRALNAFVGKDLEDHQARLLLCVEPLASLLPPQPSQCRLLIIPRLAALAHDVSAKRALWQALVDARS